MPVLIQHRKYPHILSMLQIHVQLLIEIILFRNIHFLYMCTFDEKGARKAYIRLGLSAVNFLPFCA